MYRRLLGQPAIQLINWARGGAENGSLSTQPPQNPMQASVARPMPPPQACSTLHHLKFASLQSGSGYTASRLSSAS
jgi:hypothetical protein